MSPAIRIFLLSALCFVSTPGLGQEPESAAQIHFDSARSAYLNQASLESVWDLSRQAAHLAAEARDTALMARNHLLQGVLSRKQAKIDEAIQAYLQAISLYKAIEDQGGMGKAYLNLGNLYSAQEQDARALESYQQAEEAWQNLPLSPGALADLAQNKAIAYQRLGAFDKAKSYYRVALGFAEQDSVRLAALSNNLGDGYFEQAQYDSARYFFQVANRMYEPKYDNNHLEILANLGIIENHFAQYQNALDRYLLPALQKANENAYLTLLPTLYWEVVQAYKQLQQPGKAFPYLEQYQYLTDSLQESARQLKYDSLSLAFETEKKEKKLANQQLTTARLQITTQRQGWGLLCLAVLLLGLGLAFVLNRRRQKLQKYLLWEELNGKLRQQEVQSMKMLMDRIDAERTRISLDLHNRLGNLLVVARYALQGMLQQQDPDEQQKFELVDSQLAKALQAVRMIAHSMNEGVMVELGLIPKIEMLQESVQNATDLKVYFHHNLREGLRLPLQVEQKIYSMIEELITNALKHAQAQNLYLHLYRAAGKIELSLEDDGQGFEASREVGVRSEKPGMGLAQMKKELLAMGGSYTVDSVRDRGTSLLLEFPLDSFP